MTDTNTPSSSKEAMVRNASPLENAQAAFRLVELDRGPRSVLRALVFPQAAPPTDGHLVAFGFGVQPEHLPVLLGLGGPPGHADLADRGREEPDDQQEHDRKAGLGEARPGAGPRVERAQERPKVLEGARDELQATKTFAHFAEPDATLPDLVPRPADSPLHPLFGDAELEATEVQVVPDPLQLLAALRFVPGQGRPQGHKH